MWHCSYGLPKVYHKIRHINLPHQDKFQYIGHWVWEITMTSAYHWANWMACNLQTLLTISLTQLFILQTSWYVQIWCSSNTCFVLPVSCAHKNMIGQHASGNWIQKHQRVLTLRTTRCWICRGIWCVSCRPYWVLCINQEGVKEKGKDARKGRAVLCDGLYGCNC